MRLVLGLWLTALTAAVVASEDDPVELAVGMMPVEETIVAVEEMLPHSTSGQIAMDFEWTSGSAGEEEASNLPLILPRQNRGQGQGPGGGGGGDGAGPPGDGGNRGRPNNENNNGGSAPSPPANPAPVNPAPVSPPPASAPPAASPPPPASPASVNSAPASPTPASPPPLANTAPASPPPPASPAPASPPPAVPPPANPPPASAPTTAPDTKSAASPQASTPPPASAASKPPETKAAVSAPPPVAPPATTATSAPPAKATTDKPKDEKPKDEKPKDEKPKDEKPKDEKPKDEKPKDEKPKDEKPKGPSITDPLPWKSRDRATYLRCEVLPDKDIHPCDDNKLTADQCLDLCSTWESNDKGGLKCKWWSNCRKETVEKHCKCKWISAPVDFNFDYNTKPGKYKIRRIENDQWGGGRVGLRFGEQGLAYIGHEKKEVAYAEDSKGKRIAKRSTYMACKAKDVPHECDGNILTADQCLANCEFHYWDRYGKGDCNWWSNCRAKTLNTHCDCRLVDAPDETDWLMIDHRAKRVADSRPDMNKYMEFLIEDIATLKKNNYNLNALQSYEGKPDEGPDLDGQGSERYIWEKNNIFRRDEEGERE